MTLLDLVNIGFGFYKGYMEALGIDIDPAYSAYLIAGYSTLCGTYGGVKAARHNIVATGRALSPLDELLFRNRLVKLVFGELYTKSWSGNTELNPYNEGAEFTVRCACESILEIAIGYGIGYVAQKIIC